MPYRHRKPYLICYDISDPRRLQKLHRYLRQRALPVQYSVFYASLTNNELRRIKDGINLIIEPREDDIRIYHLPDKPAIETLGRDTLPTGLQLLDPQNKVIFTSPHQPCLL